MNSEAQQQAFSLIIREYLRLCSRRDLLVIYDESFAPYYNSFIEAFQKEEISVTLVSIPFSYQLQRVRDFNSCGGINFELPAALKAAISVSSAVLNFLGPDLRTSSFRRAILHEPRSQTCRLAHVPGMTNEILMTVLKTPTSLVLEYCEAVAWAIGEARELVLHTRDCANNLYTLNIKLQGWENEPIMSPGVVFEGSWGNIPPGETFCCPVPEHVNGAICINGSIPHQVIDNRQEAILEFNGGKLTRWSASANSPVDSFLRREQEKASELGDENWNTFAELGIGLNPAITTLTGNSLFDEKALGTVHVAIGDNSGFGRNIVSTIHADMVTTSPTMSLDGHVLIDQGRLLMEDLKARRSSSLVTKTPVPEDSTLYLRPSKWELQDGRLKRRLFSGNRIGHVEIGPDDISQSLGALIYEMKTYDRIMTAQFLRDHPRFGEFDTAKLLSVLNHYKILGFFKHPSQQ